MKVIKMFLLSNMKGKRDEFPLKKVFSPHTIESANELLPGAFYLSGKHQSRVLRSKKSYWRQKYSVERYSIHFQGINLPFPYVKYTPSCAVSL